MCKRRNALFNLNAYLFNKYFTAYYSLLNKSIQPNNQHDKTPSNQFQKNT